MNIEGLNKAEILKELYKRGLYMDVELKKSLVVIMTVLSFVGMVVCSSNETQDTQVNAYEVEKEV